MPSGLPRFDHERARPDSYPISSFTWLLLYQHPKDAAKGKILTDFMKWVLTDGQGYCADSATRRCRQWSSARDGALARIK